MTSEFPHTPPRKSYTFSDAVNAEIRRAADIIDAGCRGAPDL